MAILSQLNTEVDLTDLPIPAQLLGKMVLDASEQAIFDRAAAKLKTADVNVELIPANGCNPVWIDMKSLVRFELNETLVLQKYASGITLLYNSYAIFEFRAN